MFTMTKQPLVRDGSNVENDNENYKAAPGANVENDNDNENHETAPGANVENDKTAPGAGPRHLVLHPSLPLAFLVCELQSRVQVKPNHHHQ